MLKYPVLYLTVDGFDSVFSRLIRTKLKEGAVFRLYYSETLDTNVHFSGPVSDEVAKKLKLRLIGEKQYFSIHRVK